MLPVEAVIQNAANAVVWVQTGKDTYEPRGVVTGLQSGGEIEIVSGLKEGEPVVVSGAYLLNSEFVFKRGANPGAGMDANMKM